MPNAPRSPGRESTRPEADAPSGQWPTMRISVEWREALWVTFIVRVGLLALGVVMWLQSQVPGPCHFEIARNGWTTIPPLASGGLELPLVGVWQRWDACWYAKIAAFGYEPGGATAFFPAFPLLERALGAMLDGHIALGGMIVNLIASVVGLAGLHRLVARDMDVRVADRTVLYLSIFPAALFLYAPFTEAVFVAATAWAFVGAREGRWWLTAVAALLAGLTRTQGILLVLPLGWEAASVWRATRLRADGGEAGLGAVASRLATGAAVVAPVIGFGVFLWYTSAVVGQPLFDAQDAWGGREFHPPWETIKAAFDWVATQRQSAGVELLNLAGLLFFAVVTALSARRLPASYSLYAAASLLLIALRLQPTPLTSTMRLLLVIFPVFVALGIAGRQRRFDLAWTVGSTLLLGLVTAAFVRGDFVA